MYKHGGFGTRLYKVWANMKQRCENPNKCNFYNYGGRGITICNEWLEFIPFRDWALHNGYAEGLQINRIENNGNYEPSNCNWITCLENNKNKRNIKASLKIANEIRIKYKTSKYTQRKLAKEYNINQKTVFNILHNRIWIEE